MAVPHSCSQVSFPVPTTCTKCGSYIWGVSGYRCDGCLMPIHKNCKTLLNGYKTLTGKQIKCSRQKGVYATFEGQNNPNNSSPNQPILTATSLQTISISNKGEEGSSSSSLIGEKRMMTELKKGTSFQDPNEKESRKATFDLDSLSIPIDSGHQKGLTLTLLSISVHQDLKSRSGTAKEKDFNASDKPVVFIDINNDLISQRKEGNWDCEVNATEHYKFEDPIVSSFLYRDTSVNTFRLSFDIYERRSSHSKIISLGHGRIELESEKWDSQEKISIEIKKDKKIISHLELKGSVSSLTLNKMITEGDVNGAVGLLRSTSNCWVNGKDTAGWTLLHTACGNWRGDSSIINALLEYKGIDVNIKNQQGHTPLFFLGNGIIESFNDEKAVSKLIKKFHAARADFQIKNDRRENIIHNCLIKRNKNPNFLAGLLEGLQNVLSETELKEVVNAKSGFKQRIPIHYAARLHPNYFKILQKYGADISIRDVDDMTALDLAEVSGTKEMRTFLHSKGFKVTRDIEAIKSLSQESWIIDASELQFERLVASGTSGDVWKGSYVAKICAIKVLKGSHESENYSKAEVEEFKKEALLNSMIQSPYIVKFYGVCLQPLYLVMEFCENGSLYNVMTNKPQFMGWPEFFRFSIEMSKAINSLHSAKPQIVHRDLKSLNIMVNERFTLKLGDFGLSRTVTEDNSKTFRQQRGTSSWKAPEIIKGETQGAWCDVYSLGIIFWEMANCIVLGKYNEPFIEYNFRNSFALENAIGKKNARPTLPRLCPQPIKNLIERAWDPEIKNRPNCPQLIGTIYSVEEIYEMNCKAWDELDFSIPSNNNLLQNTVSSGSAEDLIVLTNNNNPQGSPILANRTENQLIQNQLPPQNQSPQNQSPQNQSSQNQSPQNQPSQNQSSQNQSSQNQSSQNQSSQNQFPQNQFTNLHQQTNLKVFKPNLKPAPSPNANKKLTGPVLKKVPLKSDQNLKISKPTSKPTTTIQNNNQQNDNQSNIQNSNHRESKEDFQEDTEF